LLKKKILKSEFFGTNKGVRMLVNKLETMEKIVASNSSLAWVGWDVAERKQTDIGRTAVNGIRIKDKWYTQKLFNLDRNGWEIPNKYKV
jgi:hypothetical protein